MADDPYKYFRVEARELLEGISRGMLDLEKGPVRPELVVEVLRHAHTLKGAARVVKQARIADLAHAIEDALQPHREGRAEVPNAVITTVLELADAVRMKLGELDTPRPARAAAEETFETVRVEIREVDQLLDAITEVNTVVRPLRDALSRLDDRGTGSLSDRLERNVRRLRSSADRLRLVPAGAIFDALERAARDAAHALGRRVEFSAAGGGQRLDAHVLAPLREALIHVVRNAVAHGVEQEKDRAGARKPPAGRVELRVEKRGTRAAFVCGDDGRGIDFDALRGEALRRGLLTEVDVPGFDERAAVALLLRGGLTTTGEVTAVSGRGIGLNVVRNIVERLKGELNIQSRRGRGTTVEICVPISLASTSSIVVAAGGRSASIPMECLKRIVRLGPDQRVVTADDTSMALEGESIPFLPLPEALKWTEATNHGRRPWSALILESDRRRAAIGVDRIVGVRDVVVRSVPAWVESDGLVAGVSIDDRGEPQLALDPRPLVQAAHEAKGCPSTPSTPKLPILIVDDSLTTRMLEQSILESAGYAVDLACSGEEAVERARERDYGLFIVDVEMPGMDGFEFVRRMRADPKRSAVPSVLVTSRNSPEDRRRGEEAGIRAYIVKSEFDQGRLLALIRELVV